MLTKDYIWLKLVALVLYFTLVAGSSVSLVTMSNSDAPAGSLWIEGADLHWTDGSTEYALGPRAGEEGGLIYTWHDHGRTSHETTLSGFNKYFNGRYGSFQARGEYNRRVHWHNSDWDSKPSYLPADSYAWKAEGYIYAPESGTYTFGVDSDDSSDIWVKDQRVAYWYDGHGTQGSSSADYSDHTGAISLDRGWHRFRVRMEEGSGGDGISAGWQKPGDSSLSPIPASSLAKPAQPNLLLNMRMDSGSGGTAKDNSIYGNEGTINGATWTSGKFDDALSFDGSDDRVMIDPGPSSNGDFSVSAWIKTDGTSDDSQNRNMFYQEEKTDLGKWWSIRVQDDKVKLSVDDSSNKNILFGNTNVADSSWHHVVGVRDKSSGELKIYLDGTLDGTTSDSSGSLGSTDFATIGMSTNLNDHQFDGKIDEVKVYSRALSAAEVEKLYNGAGSKSSAPKGSWWVEDSATHWIGQYGYERAFVGEDTGVNPSGASPGNAWMESSKLRFIDQNGNERMTGSNGMTNSWQGSKGGFSTGFLYDQATSTSFDSGVTSNDPRVESLYSTGSGSNEQAFFEYSGGATSTFTLQYEQNSLSPSDGVDDRWHEILVATNTNNNKIFAVNIPDNNIHVWDPQGTNYDFSTIRDNNIDTGISSSGTHTIKLSYDGNNWNVNIDNGAYTEEFTSPQGQIAKLVLGGQGSTNTYIEGSHDFDIEDVTS